MSYYTHCQRGGQNGIYTITSELQWFSKNKTKSKFIDEYIPLPNKDPQIQLKSISKCSKNHDEMEDAVYWETEKGSHGWCCSECGKVLQWG